MPSPGWYLDGSGRRRWWNGTVWTDLQPPPLPPAQPSSTPLPAPAPSVSGDYAFPFRFNPPPGWGTPPAQWVIQWAGLLPPTPAGFPEPPVGWRFWDALQPDWSAWVNGLATRLKRSILIYLSIAAVALVISVWATVGIASRGGYIILWGAVLYGAIAGFRALAQLNSLRSDPWGTLRKRLLSAA